MTDAPLPHKDDLPPVNGAFAWAVRLFLIGMALTIGLGWWLG